MYYIGNIGIISLIHKLLNYVTQIVFKCTGKLKPKKSTTRKKISA